MADIPYDYKVDEKNGVVDGRDFALKCMIHAFKLLGAYAVGDTEAYRKLLHATTVIAHKSLEMSKEPDDESKVPNLSIVVGEQDSVEGTRSIKQHLVDTADKTENLIKIAEDSGA